VDQLTTLDAGFLHAEDSDRHVSLAIGGLAVVEGPAPDHREMLSTFAKRMTACPRFAQRLRTHTFDFGAPEWVDDPDFDVTHHVRRVAVPHPGDDATLFEIVADLMATRLDRDRPLWEIWIIEGLTENRWAMLTKVHHCMADGIAATHMLAGLCDDGIGESFANHIRAAKEHSATGQPAAARKAASATRFFVNPVELAGELWNASAAITTAAARAAQGAAGIAMGLLDRSASTTLNGPVSNLRRYGAARVALDDIATICRAFDVTVNDVALAAVTESYRSMLIRRGEKPLPESLRTLVPVSMRGADALGQTDNRVSLMLPYLPIEEENPVRRLRAVHSRLDRTKSSGQRQAGGAMFALANHIPFALTAWTMRLLTRMPQRGVVTVATNVPGPRRPLHIMGRQVLGVFPVPPIAMQLRSGVAMLSYADHLFFGILTDFEAIPEAAELARGIEVAVDRLTKSSTKRKPATERHGMALVHSA
jgi:WS/DGAT/MGAT family acyltransferase